MTYEGIMDTAKSIAVSKAQDYASKYDRHSNFKFAGTFASLFPQNSNPYAILVGVKFARLQTLLATNVAPNHESIADTFIDLINYIALWGESITEKE